VHGFGSVLSEHRVRVWSRKHHKSPLSLAMHVPFLDLSWRGRNVRGGIGYYTLSTCIAFFTDAGKDDIDVAQTLVDLAGL